jgi:hypothetical protein
VVVALEIVTLLVALAIRLVHPQAKVIMAETLLLAVVPTAVAVVAEQVLLALLVLLGLVVQVVLELLHQLLVLL